MAVGAVGAVLRLASCVLRPVSYVLRLASCIPKKNGCPIRAPAY